MNSLKLSSAMVVISAALAGGAALASPLVPRAPVNAMFGRTHTVSFKLRNDSTQPMKVKAGDQEMTLEPGKAMSVKLNVGEQVLLVEATPTRPAGSLLATAAPGLSDATVALK